MIANLRIQSVTIEGDSSGLGVVFQRMSLIETTLDLHTVSESNRRGHWRKHDKRRKEQRSLPKMALAGLLRAQPLRLPLVVTLVRLAPSKGLDDDNLRGALKAVRDGVADAMGLNDNDPGITWDYAQQRRKTYGVRIRIEERTT